MWLRCADVPGLEVRMRRSVARKLLVLAVSSAVVSVGAAAPPAAAGRTAAEKTPVAVGYGGAVASVDTDASAAGIARRFVQQIRGHALEARIRFALPLPHRHRPPHHLRVNGFIIPISPLDEPNRHNAAA